MKIGILTFHRVYNYGAVIQAYCTQKIIDDLDIDNEIIDYTILKQKDFTDLYSRRNGLKRFFKTLLLIPFHSERFSRKKKFDAFINSMRLSDKKYIENEDLYIKRECDKINKIAPYCFSEKLHLPEKLQNEYDEIDIDKTIYHEFAGEFANSIKLPDGVMQIGNNAFYNCKKLESITIGKNIKEVGSDVFMNCRSLNKIYLRSDISDITGLKQVLSRISSEIEVTYIKEEKVIAKVLYPEYSEVYDEIAPAHIFGRNIEGEGFRARQCFDGGKADMNQYDTIFPKASAEESVKVAGKIALYRLMYPYMLGSSSEVLYMDYLKNNKNEIIGSCIYDKNIDEIKFMLEKFSGDRNMIERAIVVANETGFGEAAALILKYRRKKEDIRKSRYAF